MVNFLQHAQALWVGIKIIASVYSIEFIIFCRLAAVCRFSQRQIRENFHGLVLFFDAGPHQIFDGNHANQFTMIDQRQVANIGGQHFFYACLHRFASVCRYKFATWSKNLLYRGRLGRSIQQINLRDIVTLANDSGQVTCTVL